MATRAWRFCAVAACALVPLLGDAQVVYRCGPDDSRTYSDTPCPQGNGRVVDLADPRDADQWSDATDVAQRAADAGQRMEKERQHNDARARNKAIGIRGGRAGATEPPGKQAKGRSKELRLAKAACPTGIGRAPRASGNACPGRRAPRLMQK